MPPPVVVDRLEELLGVVDVPVHQLRVERVDARIAVDREDAGRIGLSGPPKPREVDGRHENQCAVRRRAGQAWRR